MVDWKKRECERFSGEYEYPYWMTGSDNQWWWKAYREVPILRHHYVHVSRRDPELVAYTPSERYGVLDRHIQMKPGRYLRKYCSDYITDDQITEVATLYSALVKPPVLKFACTADEIEAVYNNGPRSCMKKSSEAWDGPCHPVRAYAGPDLAIAYIDRGGHITARTLVWPEKKVHGTVYGDSRRLMKVLEKEGYTYGCGVFKGARLTLIQDGSNIVAPYLDGSYNYDVDTHNGYLIMNQDGEWTGQCDTGLLSQQSCDYCGNNMGAESYYLESREETWCESCYQSNTFFCEECGEAGADDDANAVNHNGTAQSWCQYCYENNSFVCDECGENTTQDERVLITDQNFEYCAPCFSSEGVDCTDCGDPYLDEDLKGGYCSHCRPEQEDDEDEDA